MEPPQPAGFAALLMHRVRPQSVPWLLGRLARGPSVLGRVPGLRFAKVLGSGLDGGFGLRPGWDCQGVFAVFDGIDAAQAFAFRSPVAAAYSDTAVEGFGMTLRVTSARGSWDGFELSAVSARAPGGPVAALTRASIRPSKMLRFWRHSPGSESSLSRAPGCRVAVGLGEAPLLRQATFSLWENQDAMDAYARHGEHQAAIAASRAEDMFSESLFARFEPVELHGLWRGLSVRAGAGLQHV